MKDHWCVRCGMWHPRMCWGVRKLDEGWTAKVGDGRWVVLCPECSEWDEALERARTELRNGSEPLGY